MRSTANELAVVSAHKETEFVVCFVECGMVASKYTQRMTALQTE